MKTTSKLGYFQYPQTLKLFQQELKEALSHQFCYKNQSMDFLTYALNLKNPQLVLTLLQAYRILNVELQPQQLNNALQVLSQMMRKNHGNNNLFDFYIKPFWEINQSPSGKLRRNMLAFLNLKPTDSDYLKARDAKHRLKNKYRLQIPQDKLNSIIEETDYASRKNLHRAWLGCIDSCNQMTFTSISTFGSFISSFIFFSLALRFKDEEVLLLIFLSLGATFTVTTYCCSALLLCACWCDDFDVYGKEANAKYRAPLRRPERELSTLAKSFKEWMKSDPEGRDVLAKITEIEEGEIKQALSLN